VRLFGRQSDKTAEFERVALAYLPELVRSATRTCGDKSTAEDMVQETYMRAWKYWDRFEPGTNCRAWLYKILFNVIRRRRGGDDPASLSIETPELAAVLPFTPAHSLTALAVADAFEKIPEDFRSPLVLVAVEGFSYKETAEILGIPIGTVMSRLHRGREAMRRLLVGKPEPRRDAGTARPAENAL
jgi:RNA polymerase sigma-70 factor (ECF subfamily)